jgi:hypothetical protein
VYVSVSVSVTVCVCVRACVCQTEPAVPIAGAALAAALIKQTVNVGEEPQSYDKTAEIEALKNVHGTSTYNRCTRIALGSVYYYSGITTYQRLTGHGSTSYWPQFAESASALFQKGDYLSAGQVFGVEAAKACSALALLYIGGIWLSSGYHAQ